MSRSAQNLEAIAWMILTGFVAVSINVIARYLSSDFHPFQLVFFYNAVGLMIYMPFVLRSHITVKTARLRLYSLRAVMEFIGFSLVFYGLTLMPLPVHTALGFTSPLFGTIAAVMFLKEENNPHRWLALIAGFAGVLIVTRPWTTDFGMSGGIMLVAALCFSVCMVCIKKLTATEPSGRVAFYMMALTAIISLPFAVSVWKWPSLHHLPYIMLMGALVAVVQFTVSQAFSKAHVSVVAPFFFLNLVWSSIYAYYIFDEVVQAWTIVGGGVILKATLYAIHHARKTHRLDAVVSTPPVSYGLVSK